MKYQKSSGGLISVGESVSWVFGPSPKPYSGVGQMLLGVCVLPCVVQKGLHNVGHDLSLS